MILRTIDCFQNMLFLNRFTCLPSQLSSVINIINSRKMLPIIDYVSENNKDIEKSLHIIHKSLISYPSNTFALKLSSFHSNNHIQNFIYTDDICNRAISNNSKIMIDAENNKLQDEINILSNEMLKKYNTNDVYVYKTYQMYRKDGLSNFIYDLSCPREYYIGFKLVRGAYLNEDKKFGVLCDSYDETNEQYNKAIEIFTKYSKTNDILLCATHNEDSIKYAIRESFRGKHNIEFAQLMGMSDSLSRSLASQGFKTYKYLPYGNLRESIPYLLRRLYENYPMMMNIFK